MNALLLQFVVWTLAGWIQRGQQSRVDYLIEENRVLREQLGQRRVRLTDDHRRRLAVRAKALGRAALRDVAGIVTPETLLRWYRNLVARKYDGSQSRTAGRPRTAVAIAKLVVRMATENPGWGRAHPGVQSPKIGLVEPSSTHTLESYASVSIASRP